MSDRVHCRTCQTDVIVTSTAMFCQCEHARDRHLQLVAAPTTEEVERLRAENAELREALEDAWERMDRARGIIYREVYNNWGMLDTSLARAALAKRGDAEPVASPGGEG